MRLEEIIKEIPNCRIEGSGRVEVLDIAYDSRKVEKGALFFALPGTNDDGLRYVPDAISRGAVAVAAQSPVRAGLPLVLMEDARAGMALASKSLFGDPSSMKLVGVTGTDGKTTVASLIKAGLEAAGIRTGLLGTIRYELGGRSIDAPMTTPESRDVYAYLAAMRDSGLAAAAMEVSSHSLVQKRVFGIDYDCGVFTNLTQDHLDFHGTREEYLKAKLILFRSLSPEAAAVVNRDSDVADAVAASTRARVIWYGIDGGDVAAEILGSTIHGLKLRLRWRGRAASLSTPMMGRHNASNIAAAAGALLGLGAMDLEDVAEALSRFPGVTGRLESIDAGQGFKVLVDYAHTEGALRSVMGALRPLCEGRLIVLFGCGGNRDRSKRPKMGRAVEEMADLAVVTSDNPRTEDPVAIIEEVLAGVRDRGKMIVEPDRAEAVGIALCAAAPGDVVLLAGKGHETCQIVGTERMRFSDRERALEVLGGMKR